MDTKQQEHEESLEVERRRIRARTRKIEMMIKELPESESHVKVTVTCGKCSNTFTYRVVDGISTPNDGRFDREKGLCTECICKDASLLSP